MTDTRTVLEGELTAIDTKIMNLLQTREVVSDAYARLTGGTYQRLDTAQFAVKTSGVDLGNEPMKMVAVGTAKSLGLPPVADQAAKAKQKRVKTVKPFVVGMLRKVGAQGARASEIQRYVTAKSPKSAPQTVASLLHRMKNAGSIAHVDGRYFSLKNRPTSQAD